MTTPINPGIRRVVAFLRARGFETCDSGDGETHDHPCDREGPYVVVKSSRRHVLNHADEILDALCQMVGGTVPNGTMVQANYSPVDGMAFVDISGICDKDLDGKPRRA